MTAAYGFRASGVFVDRALALSLTATSAGHTTSTPIVASTPNRIADNSLSIEPDSAAFRKPPGGRFFMLHFARRNIKRGVSSTQAANWRIALAEGPEARLAEWFWEIETWDWKGARNRNLIARDWFKKMKAGSKQGG
jgi:hypothetical protein